MQLLSQFLLRLAFGLAFGMAITSPRLVSSGYFRNHLYVTLGLATLATLVLAQLSTLAACLAAGAGVLSYVGSVCWLYEAARPGRFVLWLVSASALAAALVAHGIGTADNFAAMLQLVSVVTSGLVLGLTMAAMLLGHWYLNSPGMELAPLRRLLAAAGIAVGLQILVSGTGLVGQLSTAAAPTSSWWLFLVLRWSFGLCGVLVMFVMAWETLKIPNTQSATGILYVAVICTFVGELTAALLSAESAYPL